MPLLGDSAVPDYQDAAGAVDRARTVGDDGPLATPCARTAGAVQECLRRHVQTNIHPPDAIYWGEDGQVCPTVGSFCSVSRCAASAGCW